MKKIIGLVLIAGCLAGCGTVRHYPEPRLGDLYVTPAERGR